VGNDATPTIAESELFIADSGTSSHTDYDNGVVGDIIRINATSEVVITHGSSISLSGEVNFAMVSGDTLTLAMFVDQIWEETARTYAKPHTIFKTADEALTSSTLTNDTHFNFRLGPNTYYRFEGYLKVDASGGGVDLEIDITTGSAFVVEQYTIGPIQDGPGIADEAREAGTLALTTAIAQLDIDGTPLVGIPIKGTVLTHATSYSTVRMQFANTAGTGTVTVRKGSWLSFIPQGSG